ncbi:hypothetical protein [uncultured Microbulbifer sp.]|uniref:hypothetical protein n=1 Tax=uncultured Microbulbifer sp. TaxID=348147 RepID=UPI00260477A7|nr:hypothetical protein [uncultured Microbulbifer sp.]
MNIKKILLAGSLITASSLAVPAFSAGLVCQLNVKPGGQVMGNGTSSCNGIDFSFGNSTSGRWTITNITKSIDRINWVKGCNSGLSCGVTVRAYALNQGQAYIHYVDGSIEYVQAEMWYETGH